MYIVAIAWLYVTILMAASEATLVAGVLSFIFYGFLPLALLLWLFGTPQRRRVQRRSELLAQKTEAEANHSKPPI
jgi:membrane protein implicated in regulation of membrane protease activity